MDLSQELKSWRLSQHLSQAQASRKLGVELSTLQKWEQGRRRPRGLALKFLLSMLARKPAKPMTGQTQLIADN